MTDAAIDSGAAAPRRRIVGDEAWARARAEYVRMLELMATLRDDDWTRPTDCTAWDVRAMLGHLVGAIEGFASPRTLIHQYRQGAKLLKNGAVDGHLPVDGANAVQVRERADAPTAELIDRYERAIPGAMRWRRRLSWVPGTMDDDAGRFTMAELFRVILTRDTWMHRVDITRATGRALVLTPGHDGRIVEDCVLDWATRHGRAFSLELSGPAGGRFGGGGGVTASECDAVEFVRALSGRGTSPQILGTRVVF
ncbi:MAG: hypothetical protein NVS9B8_12510 [Candidatus Limnocylindrales bacterium]